MKVTKYPQSCLIIEDKGKRLIIDPGSLVTKAFKVTDLLPLDGVLITHEHSDHADPNLIRGLVGNSSVEVVGNQSTRSDLGDVISRVVSDGEEFELGGFKIKAVELPHCPMTDGSPGPQNTGFLIDGTFFHPGDGTGKTTLTVERAAVTLAGPDISPRDVMDFISSTHCHTVIPVHYDYFPADTDFFKGLISQSNPEIKFIALDNGESAEI